MAVIYYPKGQFVAQRTTQDPLSASYETLVIAANPDTVLFFDTASGLNAASASNLSITASWAQYAVSTSYALQVDTSASYASSSTTASHAVTTSYAQYAPYFGYTTLSPNFTNGFTASFADVNEFIPLTYTASYFFTHSNAPQIGQMSDLVIVISSSAVPTSSLNFPTQWKCLTGTWPTWISGSRIGVVTLRAVDANLILGFMTSTSF